MYRVELRRRRTLMYEMNLCQECGYESMRNLGNSNFGNMSWTFVLQSMPDDTECDDCRMDEVENDDPIC